MPQFSNQHGHRAQQLTSPTYMAWLAMRKRCLNPAAADYPSYGGAGIKIHPDWDSFPEFLSAMGERPSPAHTLDRLENSKGYEPGNCRWATQKEQQRNRTNNRLVTAFGETLTVAEWAERKGLVYETLVYRLNRKWEPEKALTTPVQHPRHRRPPVH